MGEDRLTLEFEANRARLRTVAYRMLGSRSDADDAVQEAWLRLHRADPQIADNLAGWLTTVVSRICLDMLRARKRRDERPFPDVVVSSIDACDPEDEALLAESVGLALLVVLDTLAPAERLAVILHDMFEVPYVDIAPILDRSPAATKQLAMRGRARLRATDAAPALDRTRQREVVEAFVSASRAGEFARLIAVLAPDVQLHADAGPGDRTRATGAREVAERVRRFSALAGRAQLVLVNGTPGLLVAPGADPIAVLAFTVRDDRIARIDILADPARLADLTDTR